MATTLNRKLTSLTPGALVELFEVDLRPIGATDVLRLTPNRGASVPEQVLRVTDTSTTSRPSANLLTIDGVAGEAIVVEAYVRVGTPDNFMAFQISNSNTSSVATGYGRVRVNPSTLAVSVLSGTTVTGLSAKSAVSGNYTYIRMQFSLISGNTPVYLWLVPAAGLVSEWAAENNAATGYTDVAYLSVSRQTGGRTDTFVKNLSVSAIDYVSSGGTLTNPVETGANLMSWVPVWAGNPYTPIPFQAEGFERSGTGPFPRPKVRMSNLFNEGSALAQEYGDLRGAVVTRRRVYADNLDNGTYPDPMAQLPPDVFSVDRKSQQNGTVIEWELASALDQQGVMLPGRQILRDVCPWIYRSWDGSKFVYASENGCPYTGTAYFDANGAAVAQPEKDKCSHQLRTGCRARYGKKEDLPFGGFPMVGRVS